MLYKTAILVTVVMIGSTACVKNPENNSNLRGSGNVALGNNGSQQNPPKADPSESNEDRQDSNQPMDLLTSASTGNTIMVIALLDTGTDPNTKDENGMTPLMAAASNGHAETVKVLLAEKADPAEKDNNGLTAMMYAARSGRNDIVELLKAAGAKE